MLSPDSATSPRDFGLPGEDDRHYAATRFDKGAVAFIYVVLSTGLVVALVEATLRF